MSIYGDESACYSRIGGAERYSVSFITEKWVEEERSRRFTARSVSCSEGCKSSPVLVDVSWLERGGCLSCCFSLFFDLEPRENKRFNSPIAQILKTVHRRCWVRRKNCL